MKATRNASLTIIKRSPDGTEVMRYPGRVLRRDAHTIVVEARFNRPDLPFLGTVLRLGDRFVETYFTERWYNLFEIHDLGDERLKGWYCNIARPAELDEEGNLCYVDLALDLWVAPDGKQTVLDEDEFAALNLDADTRSRARAALAELQQLFSHNSIPGISTGDERR